MAKFHRGDVINCNHPGEKKTPSYSQINMVVSPYSFRYKVTCSYRYRNVCLQYTYTVSVCVPILVTTFPEWLSGTVPLPHTPVRPRCVYSVLRAHVQFCRFDKEDAVSDILHAGFCNVATVLLEDIYATNQVGNVATYIYSWSLILLHAERPKLYGVSAVLSMIGLNRSDLKDVGWWHI